MWSHPYILVYIWKIKFLIKKITVMSHWNSNSSRSSNSSFFWLLHKFHFFSLFGSGSKQSLFMIVGLSLSIYRFPLNILFFFFQFLCWRNQLVSFVEFSPDYILLITFSWYYLISSYIPFTIYELVGRSVSQCLIWNFHQSQNCQINAQFFYCLELVQKCVETFL